MTAAGGGASMNGPITVTDAHGNVLRVIPVSVAIAERDKHDAQKKQRQAIAANVANARMRRERAK